MRLGPTTEAGLESRRAVLGSAVETRMGAAAAGVRRQLQLQVPFHPVELDKRRCEEARVEWGRYSVRQA